MQFQELLWIVFSGVAFESSFVSFARASLYPESSDPKDIHFYFYPFPGEPKRRIEIFLGDVARTKAEVVPYYRPAATTVFVIHGFVASYVEMEIIKTAYLETRVVANVILVDWGPLSRPWTSYLKIVERSLPTVAQRMLEMIFFLESLALAAPSRIHMVGHSLGAHICGGMGTLYKMKTGKSIARITGLDPAGPGFDLFQLNPSYTLDSPDASFVDIIHTNFGMLGTATVEGHINFHVNGGERQPWCPLSDALFSCSHRYSISLYALTVKKLFIACSCSRDVFKNPETRSKCEENCKKPVVFGMYTPSGARGEYFVRTPFLPT